jgi:hypothetical protein
LHTLLGHDAHGWLNGLLVCQDIAGLSGFLGSRNGHVVNALD